MEEEKRTREHLIEAAAEEFLAQGFEKASLRKICERAGVTTGALYFFFENKEALFCQIVEPVLAQIERLGKELAATERKDISLGPDMDKKLMELLWRNRREVQLLLEKSAGTRYADFESNIYSQMEWVFSEFFQEFGNMGHEKELIRILVKMRIKGFMELLHGEYSMEEMLRLTEMVGCYADSGFQSLMEKYGERAGPRGADNGKGFCIQWSLEKPGRKGEK